MQADRHGRTLTACRADRNRTGTEQHSQTGRRERTMINTELIDELTNSAIYNLVCWLDYTEKHHIAGRPMDECIYRAVNCLAVVPNVKIAVLKEMDMMFSIDRDYTGLFEIDWI